MTQTIEAIYQNGMFKPLSPVSKDLSDGEKVKLVNKRHRINCVCSTGKIV